MSVTLAVLGAIWRLVRVAALSLPVLPATADGNPDQLALFKSRNSTQP